MHTTGTLVHGMYLDSVKLMLVSKEMRKKPGIQDAVAIMATPENLSILKATEMLLPEFEQALDSDICIAIKAETSEKSIELLDQVMTWLTKGLPGVVHESDGVVSPKSIETAVKLMPEANLALISVAGKYAGTEARKALQEGLNVLLFSDNVSLQTELELKKYALSKGLLMMGPDCGTAIVNGVPLAFANAVRRGRIGIVSASGTGLQEVICVIHNQGEGISQAFGTGGRDGKKEIGGLMLLACLDYLIQNAETEVIVLISKVPDEAVVSKLWDKIRITHKPVVVNFLRPFEMPEISKVYTADNLSETALKACQLLTKPSGIKTSKRLFDNRKLITLPTRKTRKYLRGLFSGGTLCYEAQNIFQRICGTPAFSNVPLESKNLLEEIWQSKEDTIVDLGADDYTVGRPHPMIDYSLRIKRLEQESRDTDVAVILLDVVLGYGSHPAPHLELAPVIAKIKKYTCIVVVCAVVGTDDDPQNRQEVFETLQKAGAIVTDTNAEACELAAKLIKSIRRG